MMIGFYLFFFSAVSPIDNIAQRRSTCDGIVCAMRSQVGVYHNHIGTTALCVGIYRAHTVYAVIANGRANIFLFPRSTHHFIRIYLQTDARSSLLLFPDTSSPAAGHCYRIFRFLRYYIFSATTTFIYDRFPRCRPPDYILYYYYYCRLPKNTEIVIIYNEWSILHAVLRWLYIKINENIFRENVS